MSLTHQRGPTGRARGRSEPVPSAAPDPTDLIRHHLQVVRTAVRSDRALAGILGVDPAQISRWRSGTQVPDPENADRLAALSVVVEILSRWLHPEAVPDWLEGRNTHLQDRSAAFMIRNGRLAQVLGAMEAERAGAFA
jgi:transcriptional regulator with XRE-family HTH domain